jgi:M3 family oligoendopeptidase
MFGSGAAMIATTPFTEMKYERVPLDEMKSKHDELQRRLPAADAAGIVEIVREWTRLRSRYQTMNSLNSVQYTIDTRNTVVKQERKFLDDQEPTVEEWDTLMRRALLAHPHLAALEKTFGRQFISSMETAVQTFDPKIAEHLRKQSELVMQYTDLLASAKIEFQGKTYNLSGLDQFMQNEDREIRHQAAQKRFAFFQSNGAKLDQIYDDLVKLRHEMAQLLGYPNYIPLAYKLLFRTDYGPTEVEVLRAEVRKHVVPLAVRIREQQKKMVGAGELKFWDLRLIDGKPAPRPLGNAETIVQNTARMYNELSPETGEFFQMMNARGLFDLVTREGKAGGGYCTSFPDFGVPFVFSNFNGTKDDVEVMTHECGHAFQNWSSRNQPLLEYQWPTYEACEIHSMGMEFLTYPWMELYFGEEAERFRRIHMTGTIVFLPYGCLVDEFQHFVYANPGCGPAARKAQWRELEKKYLPWTDYGDLEYPASGGFWQVQGHIYNSPFYYIDYVLAQTCALQIWKKARENREKALSDYMAICAPGGSQSFLQLVKTGDLRNPFDPGVIGGLVAEIDGLVKQGRTA